MRKALLGALLCLPLLLGASGQFGISTPLVTYVPASGYNPCLTGAWPMQEGTGTVLHDIIHTNNLTMSGGSAVTWQTNTGLPGATPYWNGTGYAVGSNSTYTNFTGATPFSVAMWVEGNVQTGTYQQLVGSAAFSGTYQGWDLLTNIPSGPFNIASQVIVDIANNLPTNAIQVVPQQSPTIDGGQLSFEVITYDGSQNASGIKAYFNPTSTTPLSQTVNYNTLTSSSALSSPIYVGQANGGTIPFEGAMAFLAIYDCVITGAQALSYYNAGPRIN